MSVPLDGVVETVPLVIFAVVIFAVETPNVPTSSVVTADPAVSKYTALSAG
jgi:hypothetical protein